MTAINPQLEEHDDDKPVGRLFSRREMLSLFGSMGAAALAGGSLLKLGSVQFAQTVTPTALPACVVRPALTEGPYFVDEMLNRSDIRINTPDETLKEGALLKIVFKVSDVSNDQCAPLAGAQVDVWHCDALGVYSGVEDPGFDTQESDFLRGYQVTDEFGTAEFITVYPGWYSGRAVHIHFKIRTDPESDSGYEFTSQFFFDEELTDKVQSAAPYNSKGERDTFNADDGIFQGSEGLLTLDITELDEDDELAPGYTATFDIGLDLSQPAEEVGGMGGGVPPSGGPGGGNPPPSRP